MSDVRIVVSGDDSEVQKMFDRIRKKSKETTSEIKKDFDRAATMQKAPNTRDDILKKYADLAAQSEKIYQSKISSNTKLATEFDKVSVSANQGKASISGLSNSIENSGKVAGKTTGIFRLLGGLIPGLGLTTIAAFAIEPIIEWVKGLDLLGSKFKKIAAEGVGSAEYKKAIDDVTRLRSNLDLAEKGLITKNKVVKEYNESLGKTQGHLKTIDQIQQWEQKNAAKYLEYMSMKTQAQALYAAATDKAAESAKKMVEGPGIADYAKATLTNFFGGSGLFSMEGIAAEAERRNFESAKKDKMSFGELVKQAQKMEQDAIAYAKKNGIGIDAIEAKDHTAALNARLNREKSLMAEITKIRLNASRKQLDGQESELKAISDSYDLITKKVQDFFTDPKNKGTKLNVGQIFSDLTKAENQERDAVNEKYKKQEQDKAKEHLDDLLKKYATFDDRRKEIVSDTEKAITELKANGSKEQAEQAKLDGEQQLRELDTEIIQTLDAYKNLYDHIGEISRKETLNRIEILRKELDSFKGDAKAKAKILADLNKLEKGITDDNKKEEDDKEKKRIQDLNDTLSALRLIATEFDNLNDSLGKAASFLLASAKAYIEIKENASVINSDKATSTQKITAGIGIVGAALGVANAVVGYFKGLKAAKEAAKKAMNDFQQNAIKGEREYQALLRKRDVDSAARGKSTYQALVAQLEALKKQSPEIQKAYEKVYAALQGQSSVEVCWVCLGGWLRKAKTWDIMASLAGADYDRLEKLYSEGKLKDQAKADFEALRTLRDELEAAGLSVQSLQDQLSSLLTGTTAGGLADSLSQLFQNGKFAAQDFGDSFEEIMKNAIVNSFKYKVMEDAMKPFYDEFASLFLNGTPSAADIDALKEKYQAIGLQLGDQFRELENITGRSLTTQNPADTSNTMAGAITSIRAEQADLLASRVGGIQISNLEMLSIQRQQLDINRQCYEISMNALNTYLAIERNTLRTADNTERLKGIETALVSMEKKVSSNANAAAAAGIGGFGG